MKLGLKLTFIALLLSTQTACSVIMDDPDKDNATPQSEMCRYLKRQMTFNSINNSRDVRFATPSQKQELQQRYNEYGCE